MTKQEIITAIQSNKSVYWRNEGYSVILQNDKLFCVFTYNQYMAALQPSEYNGCFIGG